MKPIHVSLEEQEATINIYPSQVSETCDIYSSIPHLSARLLKMADTYPDAVKVYKNDSVGLFVTVPRNWITIRKPRSYSPEQREKMTERLKALRK